MAVSYLISHKVMTVQGTFLLYSYWQALKKKNLWLPFYFLQAHCAFENTMPQ